MSNIIKTTFSFNLKKYRDKAKLLEQVVCSKTNCAVTCLAFVSINDSKKNSHVTENDGVVSLFLSSNEPYSSNDIIDKYDPSAISDILHFAKYTGLKISKGSLFEDIKLVADFITTDYIGCIFVNINDKKIALAVVDAVLYMPMSILKEEVSFAIDLLYTDYHNTTSYYKEIESLEVENEEETIHVNKNFFSDLLGIKKVTLECGSENYAGCEAISLYKICPSDQYNLNDISHGLSIIGEKLKLENNSPTILLEFIKTNVKNIDSVNYIDINKYGSVGDFLYNNKNGTFIVYTESDHIFAYIDGIWYDNEYRHSIENHILSDNINFVIAINKKEEK